MWSKIKNLYKSLYDFVNAKQYRSLFLIFSLFFIVFFAMYFSVGTLSAGDDHFFHFRFAQGMLSKGFFNSFQDFKSIYFSRMAQGNDYFVYYNFIFFLLILPFTSIAPLYLGIKLYAVFVVAIAFTLLYWCLRKFEIKHPFVWVLAIVAITNVSSIWRFFLSRPYAFAPSLLLLLSVLLYKKKYIWALIISFVYLYWHSATFFLPLCVALGYYVVEKFYREKGDLKNLGAVFLGTILAIVCTYFVSSGFLLFIRDTVFGIYWDTILGKHVPIQEGGELYPIDFFNFIQSNALIFAAFVTAISVDIFSYVALKLKRINEFDYYSGLTKDRRYLQTTILILTALFFLGTVVTSARFGDYFTMFAGLYIGLSFDYIFRIITISGSDVLKKGIITGLCVVLVYLFSSNMLFLQQKLAYGQKYDEFYDIGMWLNQNTKKGDIVFDADWSWFPQLYYFSPNDNYTSGLEPRFMYDYNPALYWEWMHIVQDGFVCKTELCPDIKSARQAAFSHSSTTEQWAKSQGDKIASVLSGDFKSKYVVSSKDFLLLDYILDHNHNFTRLIYDNVYGHSLYKINTSNSVLGAK